MKRVYRGDIKIKRKPQQNFEPGAIFQYKGEFQRLKGFVLVHEVDPELEALSKRDKRTVIADDHVVAEVLIPERGYSDECLFWVEKRFLSVPLPEDFSAILREMEAEKRQSLKPSGKDAGAAT